MKLSISLRVDSPAFQDNWPGEIREVLAAAAKAIGEQPRQGAAIATGPVSTTTGEHVGQWFFYRGRRTPCRRNYER